MEERGLKISRKKTEYFRSNGHQDADRPIYLQGETVNIVKITYCRSTLVYDGKLDAEDAHMVQNGWRNWKSVSGTVWSVVRLKTEGEDQGECGQDKLDNGKTGAHVQSM